MVWPLIFRIKKFNFFDEIQVLMHTHTDIFLYPSSIDIMDGVAKGKLKVIPSNCPHEQFMSYDTFFIEINILKLSCKSTHPYRFGQVFKDNEANLKIFCNEPFGHYYLNKIASMTVSTTRSTNSSKPYSTYDRSKSFR